jgi:flagellin
MSMSVQTNRSALVALQNLNKTGDELEQVQGRTATGPEASNASDNAAAWTIAQGQRANIGTLTSVKMSLDRARAIAEVSSTAGEAVSDLLVQLKEKVAAAMDASIDTSSRTALDADFKSILRQITQTVQDAQFGGANLLDGSLPGNLKFLANADANSFITLSKQTLSLGGAIITIDPTASLGTITQATNILAQLSTSISLADQALGTLRSQQKQIEGHSVFVTKLTDVLTSGVGNLVDADLAKESARLQALQVQQQLGAQALSIANSAPQVILQLFRGG